MKSVAVDSTLAAVSVFFVAMVLSIQARAGWVSPSDKQVCLERSDSDQMRLAERCLRTGEGFYSTKDGPDKVDKKRGQQAYDIASDIFRKECNKNGTLKACLLLSQLLTKKENTKKNPKEAKKLEKKLDKALRDNCFKKKDGAACFVRAQMFEEGKWGSEKDAQKAKKLYKVGCSLRNGDACAYLHAYVDDNNKVWLPEDINRMAKSPHECSRKCAERRAKCMITPQPIGQGRWEELPPPEECIVGVSTCLEECKQCKKQPMATFEFSQSDPGKNTPECSVCDVVGGYSEERHVCEMLQMQKDRECGAVNMSVCYDQARAERYESDYKRKKRECDREFNSDLSRCEKRKKWEVQLLQAAAGGNAGKVKQLLKALQKDGYAPFANPDFETPLILAARKGHLKVVEALLDAETDKRWSSLHAVDKYGKTALDYALENNHTAVIEFLKKKGAKTAVEYGQVNPMNKDTFEQPAQ
ncbi:MAG: ankyrin repeat domain-containing protein [Deltaproteobacteria bacterium]|nr:ankyrin repeat domain-containing protein [Deltaproteobacteria bacterium]MBN2674386.1 ankyrin repeat domain-containing protein [Deltaproteobacteria bacterium]